jgi:ribosomal 30S subunit maturation factor RimM
MHVVRFAPGVAQEAVAALRGAAVLLPADAVTADGAWRLRDLAGMAAVDAQGLRLGCISEVYEGRGDGALKIELDAGGAMVVPAIPAVLMRVDLAAGTVQLGDCTPYRVACDAD